MSNSKAVSQEIKSTVVSALSQIRGKCSLSPISATKKTCHLMRARLGNGFWFNLGIGLANSGVPKTFHILNVSFAADATMYPSGLCNVSKSRSKNQYCYNKTKNVKCSLTQPREKIGGEFSVVIPEPYREL